jgi:hypothetical protein
MGKMRNIVYKEALNVWGRPMRRPGISASPPIMLCTFSQKLLTSQCYIFQHGLTQLHFVWKQWQVIMTNFLCSAGWDPNLLCAKCQIFFLEFLSVAFHSEPTTSSTKTDALYFHPFVCLSHKCLTVVQYGQKSLDTIVSPQQHKNRKEGKKVLITNAFWCHLVTNP